MSNKEPTEEYLEKYGMNNPLGMILIIIPMTVLSIVNMFRRR